MWHLISDVSLKKRFEAFEKSLGYKNVLNWTNIILIALYHVLGVYWSYHYAFPVKWQTVLFAVVMYVFSGFGVTGGAHRLWTHRAYKANLPLQLFLLTCFTAAGQNSVNDWVRDHRVHHKYSDTDADPHNANRGLFFSHIGWLLTKKNPQVLSKGKQIDMSDIYDDPLLQWHKRYFGRLKLAFCFVLPSAAAVWFWNESWACAIAWQCFLRYIITFHCELTVNSFAHTFGYKPFNKAIMPSENTFVARVTLGEGWHNYHHAFPWDYKAAEYCDYLNITTMFINMFHAIGWATELKQASPELIAATAAKTGDGSFHSNEY